MFTSFFIWASHTNPGCQLKNWGPAYKKLFRLSGAKDFKKSGAKDEKVSNAGGNFLVDIPDWYVDIKGKSE
jgi:hypothetical protein